MRTIKDTVNTVVVGLGGVEGDFDKVWSTLQTYPLPLTERSLVYQVADAMKESGLEPDESAVSGVIGRL